jgi:hypothetical protein
MYMTVLMTAMLVTVIGLGGLMAARTQFQLGQSNDRAMQARFYAQSAIDLGLQKLRTDANWRSNLTNNTWSADQTCGLGLFRWKPVDELDGVLNNNASDEIRMYGTGVIGDTVRTYSVALEPPPDQPNLLRNPGFESGFSDWSNNSSVAVASIVAPYEGTTCAAMSVRLASTASVYQDVSGVIQSGKTYYVEAWARTAALTENVSIAIQTTGSISGTTIFVTSAVSVGSAWTKVSGNITPSWTGSLVSSRWSVFSYPSGGILSFDVDAAVMRLAADPTKLTLVPGSWRREVSP